MHSQVAVRAWYSTLPLLVDAFHQGFSSQCLLYMAACQGILTPCVQDLT